jgi:hypothetical protein
MRANSQFYPLPQNHDGSFDAICMRCFSTIADSADLAELKIKERAHVCSVTTVQRIGSEEEEETVAA